MQAAQIRPVDTQYVKTQLYDPKVTDGIVEELYRFGEMLNSECIQRSAQIDSKLTTMMGWSLAALAALLFKYSQARHAGVLIAAVILMAALSAFLGMLIGSFALKTTTWPTPSEQDWFREEIMQNLTSLRRYHVMSLLVFHQEQSRRIATKAGLLRWVEILLLASALGIIVLLLL